MNHSPLSVHPSPSAVSTPLPRGFSLIELMVAIAIGLLIMAGMSLVFVNASTTRDEIDRTNRQIENGRYAVELLRDDLQLAGFYGEIDRSSLAAAPSTLPSLCPTDLVERTWPAGGDTGILRLHVQGLNNYTTGTPACLDSAGIKPGTDVVFVRRAKTCAAGTANCDALVADRPYLQISLCATPTVASASAVRGHALAPHPNTTEFVHRLKDCTTASPLRPYVMYLYFVDNNNVLKRAEFTGTAMANITPLVDGIENLQVDYGIDTNVDGCAGTANDGNADCYMAAPATIADWTNVVSVRVHVLARNTEASPGYSDTKTYQLGPSAGSVGPFNDGFRRHVYPMLVRIPNISGIRERP